MNLVSILCVATSGTSLLVLAVILWRRAAWRRKALSYVCRDENGNLFVTDPQTGEVHRMEVNPLAPEGQRVSVARKVSDLSPRQSRRLRKRFKQALRTS